MSILRKKSVQSIVVLLLCAGIILAGTFAWFSFTQSAVNVFEGMTNPGGNLHDDYEQGDVNKDVYVENNGNRPIYVRVRFDEFMDINGTSVLPKGVKDKVETWNPHSYLGTTVENCGEVFHDHYEWTMGGATADPDKGLKYYLPAPFSNKARFKSSGEQTKDPVAVTYGDNNEAKFIPKYGTSVTYKDDELQLGKAAYERINTELKKVDATADPKTMGEVLDDLYKTLDDATTTAERKAAQTKIDEYLKANNLGYWDKVYVVKDDGTIKETGAVAGTDYNIEFVPLRRTQTTAKIYTMAQWIAAGTPTGEFWIIDVDGWAYWGDILQPTASTGLLLSEVNLGENKPAGKWYYGINTKLQAVTYDDIAKFGIGADVNGGGGITEQGMMVLQASSGNYVFDMAADKTGANDPIYTFVNNKDSTFRLMKTDGTNTITYGPLFVYTGTTPPVNKGDIYGNGTAMGDADYGIGKTFTKDIPFGTQGVTFTIAETGANTGTAVIEGKDGKHYIKLSYTDAASATQTAWLSVGANKKFDVLTGTPGALVSSGDDVLVWTDAAEPGSGTGDRFVENASASFKIGDEFNKDSTDWVIIGMDTKTGSTTEGKTLIISKNVLEANVAKVDIATKLTALTLTDLKAADADIAPKLLTIQESMDYFANNTARAATDGKTTDPKSEKWWLTDGIVGTNGALGAMADDAADVGLRAAFWMDSAKLQGLLYPVTPPTPPTP